MIEAASVAQSEADLAISNRLSLTSSLPVRLHAVLPQTQCTRCGYPDCAAYADAMATGHADLNRCAPGGSEGIARLAALLHRPIIPLDPDYGRERPRVLASIDEDWCIGCTKCLDACPTDAIVGASKRMHTVVSAHCTGCELCVPVCPVDCIAISDDSGTRTGWDAWSAEQASKALDRYLNRSARLSHAARPVAVSPSRDGPVSSASQDDVSNALPRGTYQISVDQGDTADDRKRAFIEDALQRARTRKIVEA